MKKIALLLVVCLLINTSSAAFIYANPLDDGEQHTIENSSYTLDITNNTEVIVEGDVDANVYVNDASLDVKGNINDPMDYTISVYAINGATVEIEGNVTSASKRSVRAVDEGTSVTVGGSTSANVAVFDGATAIIEGSVTNGGASSDGTGSELMIGGDVISNDDYKGSLYVANDGYARVDGDVINTNELLMSRGVDAYSGGKVEIGGDIIVAGDNEAIMASGEGTSVSVENNVNAKITAYDGAEISINGNSETVFASGDGSSITIGKNTNSHATANDGANVSIYGDLCGIGRADGEDSSLYVKNDISSSASNDYAVVVTDGGSAVIDGNINASNNTQVSNAHGDGSSLEVGKSINTVVIINDGATANVNNDVNNFVRVLDGSELIVGGDISADTNKPAVYADNGSSVEVGGNITNETGNAIQTSADCPGNTFPYHPATEEEIYHSGTEVTVGGDVNGGITSSNTNINITGDVNLGKSDLNDPIIPTMEIMEYEAAPSTLSSMYGSDVTVNGSVNSAPGQNGWIISEYSSNVTVKEDVNASIHAEINSNVDVGGTVNNNIIAKAWSNVAVDGSVNGDSIEAQDESVITVADDANVGTIAAMDGSTINVGNQANATKVTASGADSHITVGGGTVSRIYAGGENATVSGITNVKDEQPMPMMIASVHAADGGKIEISGDVEGNGVYIATWETADGEQHTTYWTTQAVHAEDNSSITIGGNVTVQDGIIEEKTAEDGSTYSVSHPNTAIFAQEKSTVNVKGDVTTSEIDNAIRAIYGSEVNVEGEVNGGTISVTDTYSYATEMIPTGNPPIVYVSGEPSHVTVGGGTVSHVNVTGDGSSLDGIENVTAENGRAVFALGEVTVNIENNVSINSETSEITLPDGSKQTIYIGGTAVEAGEKANVNIGGNVESSGEYGVAISARNDAEVTVKGDVNGAIDASVTAVLEYDENGNVIGQNNSYGGATVIVEGTVNSENNAISTFGDSSVTVSDGVKSGGVAINAYDNSTVNVTGNVEAESGGILAADSSIVDVQGNLNSNNIGIEVLINSPVEDKGTVVVNGTVDALNKAVELSIDGDLDTDTVISALPQIIVQSLETEGDMVVVTSPSESVDQSAVTEALISQIHYIVNQEGIDSANISVFGTEKVSANGNDYVVAKETSKITLKSTNDGYVVCSVSAGKYATIEENEDGSYTITVERGGDLNLVASVKEKPAESDDSGNNQGDGGNTSGDNGNGQNQSGNTSDDSGSGQNQGDNTSGEGDNTQNQDENGSGGNGNNEHKPGGPVTPGHPDDNRPHDNGNHWGRPDHPYNPWQDTGNNQGNSGRPQNVYSDYLLLPDYSSMILTINLVGRNRSTVLRTDLEVFQKAGFATVNIVTEDASLFMAMSNLLELYGGSSRCTFVRNGNTVELWVRDALVVTVTLMKKNSIAA